jgi:hypothetical protein
MTTHTPIYSIPNRDAELRRQAFWAGFLVCLFSLLTFASAAYGLSLVAEWVRGWLWS